MASIIPKTLTYIYHGKHIKPSIHLPYISHYIQGKNMYISKQKEGQQKNHIIIQSMAYTCSSKEDKALITNKCKFM